MSIVYELRQCFRHCIKNLRKMIISVIVPYYSTLLFEKYILTLMFKIYARSRGNMGNPRHTSL